MNVVAYPTRACMKCGGSTTVILEASKYEQWRDGALIQNVWPEWTPEQRELLISGIHAACFTALFGTDDDDDDEPGSVCSCGCGATSAPPGRCECGRVH